MTIFLWLTLSCGVNVSKTNEVPEKVIPETLLVDDYKIINSTFVHLVLTPQQGAIREFGYDNFNLKGREIPEEYIKNIYFTNVLVPLIDSIVFYHRPNNSLNLEDPNAQKLYNRLFSDELKELNIEIDSITNVGLWRLTPVVKGQKIDREIGERIISYSRIIYNADRTKAIFYFQNNCSGLCGFGMFVFVEKVNGIWTITKEYNVWVS